MVSTVLGELLLALVVEDESERAPLDLTDPMAVASMSFTNAAASGWDGDEALLLGRGDARVLHVATLWDDAAEASAFRAALESRRPAIESSLAALDSPSVGSGLRLAAPAPDAVSFTLFHGVPAADLGALLGTLTVTEPAPESDAGR